MSELVYLERPAAAEPRGLLILHHGRGTDERDLLTLAGVLDPRERLHVVTPRAPFTLPGSTGFHWYAVPRVGYPDHDSFHAGYEQLRALHERLWAQTGIDPARTVLGGFSQGAVMSYATGLGQGRPVPAGILAFSGFIPTVDGWEAELPPRRELPVLIAHGRLDPVIEVGFGRAAAERLRDAGLQVDYQESESAHRIDPRQLPDVAAWLERTLAAASASA